MRRVASGRFELSVPATRAIGLFTPEGEKDWVPGWSPEYPAGEPSETPGTVFTTVTSGVETIWLIQEIDRSRHTAAYGRVTPGWHAGMVSVSCRDSAAGGCVVSVTYDMTLLAGADPTSLDVYSKSNFAAMLDEWRRALTRR